MLLHVRLVLAASSLLGHRYVRQPPLSSACVTPQGERDAQTMSRRGTVLLLIVTAFVTGGRSTLRASQQDFFSS